MQFYRVEGFPIDESWEEANNDRRVMRENVRKIARKTMAFNRKQQMKLFFYVSDAYDDVVTIGAICREPVRIEQKTLAFLKAVDLELKDVCVEEVTFHTACSLLQRADRNGYIEDDDDVLERFDLDMIKHSYNRGVDFDESLLEEVRKAAAFETAERFLARESFVPELHRIYAGKQSVRAAGHPVHYMIQTDDPDTRKGMSLLLLQSLYMNDRLRSKRYCSIEFKPGDSFSASIYDCLYKINIGGAVIVRYLADDDSEDDCATGGRETIETLCEVMKKYSNQVLTVFCLPRECTRARDIFYENLGNVSLVEFKEEFVSGERAE